MLWFPSYWIWIPWILSLWVWMPGAVASELSPEQLLVQIDQKMWPSSFVSFRRIVNIWPNGDKNETVLYSAQRGGDRMVALVVAPQKKQGYVFLRVNNDFWLRKPGDVDPVVIKAHASVVGGLFNNADLLSLRFSVNYRVSAMERVDEKALRFVLHARRSDTLYPIIDMRVHRELLVPMEVNYFSSGKRFVKRATFKNIKLFSDGVRRPSRIEMQSPLNSRYRSIMHLGRIQRKQIPEQAFDRKSLGQVGGLLLK